MLLSVFLSGCGGGGDETTGSVTSTQVLSPKNLVGAVFLVTYTDSRSFTFTVTDSVAVGLTRSDGKQVTNWKVDGYGTPVLGIEIAYGAYTENVPDNAFNVFDYYIFTFTSKTEGLLTLRENTSPSTFNDTLVQAGTFKFTTYPPTG